MKFINRKKEMARLDNITKLPDGGVAVIWGRRRVGKTRLLLEWARKHKGVYYTADESAPLLQRKYFAMTLEQALPGFGSVDYPDWTTLLVRLVKDAIHARWRGPLIIDELPYLIAASPEFPSVLQRFLDIDAKRAKMVLALCGSSQRMMQGAVLDASAPLYGRADEMIKLGPISVGYINDALDLKNSKQQIEFYAVWGGIPKYWELVKNNGGSLLECIDSIVLDPMGPLNDEPNRLLQEEIPIAVSLRPILDAIGLGAHRLSEIAARTGQMATSLGRPIQRLLELDLVLRETPYGSQEHHSKRTLYKIKDPFIRFWFDIVASRRSHFAQTTAVNRQKWLKENLQYFFSNAWEEICRQAIPPLSQEWDFPPFGQASRYWQQGQSAEWDIVAKSIRGDAILIGEAKWISKLPSEAWIHKAMAELKAKGLPPLPRPSSFKVHYALFISEKPPKLRLPPDMKVIEAKEVIHSMQ
ncbi:MAG: ATP-binding protein [Simkania negevensis]|nr:ATP-binding protein [Simkania negevensis]